MGNKNTDIAKEVAFGFLPVKKSERSFNMMDLLLIQVGVGISCFGFLVGGYTGQLLGAKEAIAAILFGNAIPVILIMPIAVLFARYGVDTFVGFRSALGYRGSHLLFALFILLNLGFVTVACFMAGETASTLAGILHYGDFLSSRNTGAPLFAIVIFLIAVFVAFKGPQAIKWFNLIGVPAFLLLLVGLIGTLIFNEGLSNVFAVKPVGAYESHARTFATAVELNVGLGFSWLVYIGQYSRLAKAEKTAFNGGFWSYGVLVNIAAILGALTALVVGSLNPSDIMTIGGPVFEVFGLILLVAGNLTAAIFLVYSQAVSYKTIFPRQKWAVAMATTFPAIFLMISPTFYDGYGKFISIVAYVMAVLGGIVITDFYLVKKQKLSIRDLYDQYGAYSYWHGINPSAIVSLVIGTALYWGLYNPLTGHVSSAFSYITAGLPTYFIAGICYYVSSKYIFTYESYKRKIEQKIS